MDDMNKMSNMNKQGIGNRGLSLIELIVVIMIIAIISGGVVVSVTVIHNADASSAADKTVAILNSARSYSVSKSEGSIWFELCKISGKGYYGIIYSGSKSDLANAKELATEKLGGESLTITVKKKNADDTVENLVVSEGHPVEFNFDKSSGALKENYTDILISGNKDKNIIVIKETGRVLVE